VPAWTLAEWPLREQPGELLAELHEALSPLHAEATPGDPRPPLDREIAEIRHLPVPEDGVVVVAREADGSVAGTSTSTWEDVPGWSHVLQVQVRVLPQLRRRGLGRLLLSRSVAIAQRRGLRLLTGRSRDNVPSGAAFCTALGAQPAMVAEENRLDLRAVDAALVDQWAAEGPARAPGYRLQFVAGRTPPALVGPVAEVLEVMNTAPREGLDVSDVHLTPELVRQYDEAIAGRGAERWAYYAVAEGSGRFVGLTDIAIEPGLPDRVFVGDTGVEPAHRGRALGKWLKAAMTRRIMDGRPAVRWVITFNAGSNDAMLAINRQLGFRTAARHTTWQLPTAELGPRLAAGLRSYRQD